MFMAGTYYYYYYYCCCCCCVSIIGPFSVCEGFAKISALRGGFCAVLRALIFANRRAAPRASRINSARWPSTTTTSGHFASPNLPHLAHRNSGPVSVFRASVQATVGSECCAAIAATAATGEPV